MPWRVGIDEAGYGPNLGPLVMTAVACRVPEETLEENLWRVLRPAVRRRAGRGANRLIVDDSKLVYSTARGLGDLETSVLSILHAALATPPATVAHLAGVLHPDHELAGEPWYRGVTPVPLSAAAETVADGANRFRDTCASAKVGWHFFRSVIVCPEQFNVWMAKWGNKAAVLSVSLVQLLRSIQSQTGQAEAGQAEAAAEPMVIAIDKHGGRNFYSSVLQEAFPDGWALPVEEGMDASVYQIQGLDRPMRITFLPRADGEHFEVALASMISKYVREALMAEFNGFWKEHVPDLEPTAGYPGDSHRFFKAIQPTLVRLRIAEEVVWRAR